MKLLLTGGLALAVLGPSDGGYRADVERWRAQREAELRADDGWLSVAGLYWLSEGDSRFGSAPDNEIVLPSSAPRYAGRFEHRGGRTRVRVEPGVGARIAGEPIASRELRADSDGGPDVLAIGRLRLHVIERAGRFAVRLVDDDSPARRGFTGLRWYPIRERHRVSARWLPHPEGRTLAIANVVGQVQERENPGCAVFALAGAELRLEALLAAPEHDRLFFIFRDSTSGHGSYGAGRFLHVEMPEAGRVVLDFNRAYSPPCAFTEHATCPLPPRVNWLPVAIEAGERDPGLH